MQSMSPIVEQKYRRKSIISIDVTYLAEDSQGNTKQVKSTYDGDDYGAVILNAELKEALHKLLGPKQCQPLEEQPPNSHKRMLMEDQTDGEDAPPECCYYVDGRWYCW